MSLSAQVIFWKTSLTKRAAWRNLAETRQTFPHADPYQECTIFNIGGNKYRLITKIYYESKDEFEDDRFAE
ncbi:MAG: type II toxin-antitoxin system HigB family toxin [Blastocatellia bacterium]